MKWMRRIRGALGVGVTWAVAWALGGLALEVVRRVVGSDVALSVLGAPPPALAIPGFIAGTLFSLVLGIAARRRRFDELSLPKVAVYGAAGGVLLALVTVALSVGLAKVGPEVGLLTITRLILPPLALFGAASAAGTLWIARRAQEPALREPDEQATLPT